MPIYAGSRYEALNFSIVEENDGTQKRFLNLRLPPAYEAQRTYTIMPKDEFDLLAYRFFGQSRQWWKFAEANELFWPLDLPQGTNIRVP